MFDLRLGLKPCLQLSITKGWGRRCHLTKQTTSSGLYLLKALRRIRLKSWFKRLHNNTVVLWDQHGSLTLKIECIDPEVLNGVKCGSLIEVEGKLAGDGVLCVENLTVLHSPLEDALCNEDLPQDPLKYTKRYHVYVKHPLVLRAIHIYSYTLNYVREALLGRGFLELPPPILGHASDPGLRGARKVQVEIYGSMFELQSSLIMYKQLYASVLGRIFYVARNIRLEPPENASTGRHLVEFTQVDVEASEVTSEDMISLAENVVYTTVKRLLDEKSSLFEYHEIERLENEVTKPPYPRLTYKEAIDELARMGIHIRCGEELPFHAEALLASKYAVPIWIEKFPVSARGFYYLEDPGSPGHNIDYNLLLPSGHGEVLDGGCREYRYEHLLRKITSIHREPVEKYSWLLELTKNGQIRPTCGWGLGIERFVKYILNLPHIVYATPHPRIPGAIGP